MPERHVETVAGLEAADDAVHGHAATIRALGLASLGVGVRKVRAHPGAAGQPVYRIVVDVPKGVSF